MSDLIETMFSGTMTGWLLVILAVSIIYLFVRFVMLLIKSWRNRIRKRREQEENRKWRIAAIERDVRNWDRWGGVRER